jgi:hypothetical protein
MAVKKAASVFPDPVGARSRVLLPERIGGHPSACARVGEAKEASNHRRTGGWNLSIEKVRNVSAPLQW